MFIPTRAEALSRLAAFTPRMGTRYASGRNYDNGPGNHAAVSQLSPYIRRRLITEAEVITAAVTAHGPENAEKFVQEVVWRSYFKGWLERRPQVWQAYCQGRESDLLALDHDRRLRRDLARAEAGETGLDCFDAWMAELVETGYLHNHARMWFASIWIFTLGLPWRLGADLMFRHLLDGDPASNTLGWRWVAGLHTRGKAYQAEAWNIATFTHQRFTPRDADLAAVGAGLVATEPDGLPPVQPLRPVIAPKAGQPTAILLTEEDCRIEDFAPASLNIVAAATLPASALRSPLPVADHVTAFETRALADAATRAGLDARPFPSTDPAALARWAQKAGATQIAMPYATRGPLHDWLVQATPALTAAGISLCEWRRDWDAAVWPHATAGFFKVKEKIPALLGTLSLP